MKITANGNKKGKKVIVTAEKIGNDWIIDINDIDLLVEFYAELEERHPIGGVFYPERDSGLFAISPMLGTWFFDDTRTEIETEGFDEEIPLEEGAIY